MDAKTYEEYHKQLFGVRRSVRYHDKREGFFTASRRLVDAIVLFSGSSAILAFALVVKDSWPLWLLVLFPILPAFASCIALVFGVGEQANLHKQLKREFLRLEQKLITLEKQMDMDQVRAITGERISIEIRESPQHRVLSRICHNELVHTLKYDPQHIRPVTRSQRLLAHFWDIEPSSS